MPRPRNISNLKRRRTPKQSADAADVRMIAPAIRERWPIPTKKRGPLVGVAVGVAFDKKAPTADRLRALAVLAGMDQANQKDEEMANTNFRLDAGKPTARVAGVVVLPPPMPPE